MSRTHHLLVEVSFERLVELLDSTDRRSRFWVECHDEIARRVRARGFIRLGVHVFRPTEDDSFNRSIEPMKTNSDVPNLGRLAEERTPCGMTVVGRFGRHRVR